MVRVHEGVQGEEMQGALQVEWVAAGVAVAVEIWVQDGAVGVQLMVTIIYMAMLVFSNVSAHNSSMVQLVYLLICYLGRCNPPTGRGGVGDGETSAR